MNLNEMIFRRMAPPGAEGDNFPRNELGLSARVPQKTTSPEHDAAAARYTFIDAQTDGVTRYADSYQLYRESDLHALFQNVCFEDATFFPLLTGEEGDDFWTVVTGARP